MAPHRATNMMVKISWDEGATFIGPFDLSECYPDDDESRWAAEAELKKTGRYWEGGGAAALCLIMLAQQEG